MVLLSIASVSALLRFNLSDTKYELEEEKRQMMSGDFFSEGFQANSGADERNRIQGTLGKGRKGGTEERRTKRSS